MQVGGRRRYGGEKAERQEDELGEGEHYFSVSVVIMISAKEGLRK